MSLSSSPPVSGLQDLIGPEEGQMSHCGWALALTHPAFDPVFGGRKSPPSTQLSLGTDCMQHGPQRERISMHDNSRYLPRIWLGSAPS